MPKSPRQTKPDNRIKLFVVDIDNAILDFAEKNHNKVWIGGYNYWYALFQHLFNTTKELGCIPKLAIVTHKPGYDWRVGEIVSGLRPFLEQSNHKEFPKGSSYFNLNYIQQYTGIIGESCFLLKTATHDTADYYYDDRESNLPLDERSFSPATSQHALVYAAINGTPKSTAIRYIAKQYNIAHHNIILYDDSPIVLNDVKHHIKDCQIISAQPFYKPSQNKHTKIDTQVINDYLPIIFTAFFIKLFKILTPNFKALYENKLNDANERYEQLAQQNQLNLTDTLNQLQPMVDFLTFKEDYLTTVISLHQRLGSAIEPLHELYDTELIEHVYYDIDHILGILDQLNQQNETQIQAINQRKETLLQTFINLFQTSITQTAWEKHVFQLASLPLGGTKVTFEDSSSKRMPHGIAQIHKNLNLPNQANFDKLTTIQQLTTRKISNHDSSLFSFWTRSPTTQNFYQDICNKTIPDLQQDLQKDHPNSPNA